MVGGLAQFHRWAREQAVRIQPARLGAKLGQGKWAMTPAELINPGGMRGVSSKSGGAELAAARIGAAWNANRKNDGTKVDVPEQWAAMARTIRGR